MNSNGQFSNKMSSNKHVINKDDILLKQGNKYHLNSSYHQSKCSNYVLHDISIHRIPVLLPEGKRYPHKFSQKIYERNVMPRDIKHQCNSTLTCIINELQEEISGQATMQNIKHNRELFHQNPQQITLQMNEKHTTTAIKYKNLQSPRQRLCASNR
jgi:hypothetical protein